MNDESIDQLITEINRLAPSNKIERIASDCFRLNRTLIKFEGNTVSYGRNKALFKDVHGLLENLDKDGIIDLSKGDLYYLSTK
jgi:hypothetical protein